MNTTIFQFGLLKAWFMHHDVEGVVWRHPDGRMAKIKGRDFGIVRNNIKE